MIEIYFLLYVVCGIGMWAWAMWGIDVLTVADLASLPISILLWPAIALVVLYRVSASNPDRVIWRRK